MTEDKYRVETLQNCGGDKYIGNVSLGERRWHVELNSTKQLIDFLEGVRKYNG